MLGDRRLHRVGGKRCREDFDLVEPGRPRRFLRAGIAFRNLGRLDIAEIGEATASAIDQLLRRQPPAGAIVRSDRAMDLARAVLSPHDQRQVISGDPLDRVEHVRLADQQHAFEHSRIDDPVEPVVAVGHNPRQHQVKAILGQPVCQVAEQGHEERVRDMLAALMAQRHDDADDIASLGAQLARHLVGAKAMFAGNCLDPLTGFGIDQRLVGQRARHGARRYPGNLGQFADIADLPWSGRCRIAWPHTRFAPCHPPS